MAVSQKGLDFDSMTAIRCDCNLLIVQKKSPAHKEPANIAKIMIDEP
jgi:hypothetical protein